MGVVYIRAVETMFSSRSMVKLIEQGGRVARQAGFSCAITHHREN